MKTKVLGKITYTTWDLEKNCHPDNDERLIFTARPEIKKYVKQLASIICEYDGDPKSVCNLSSDVGVFIDGEFVREEKREFHADIQEWRQYVDKVVKNIDYYKESVEDGYEELMRKYNAYVINGDEKLLSYCNLHHLDIEETDADELKKIVYSSSTIRLPTSTIRTASITSNPIYTTTCTIS